MRNHDDLSRTLSRIDRQSYGAYKELKGAYALPDATLYLDHVQADPFASPSKVRVRVAKARSQLPPHLFENATRRIAFQDYLARQVKQALNRRPNRRWGSGKSGLIDIDAGGQEVLERAAVVVHPEWVEARISVGLPANGRRVLGQQAHTLLLTEIPKLAEQGLCRDALNLEEAQAFVFCIENQEHIRNELEARGLVAFVANGAVLPRVTGASDRPLVGKEAVPVRAPDSLAVQMDLLHPIDTGGQRQTALTGLGIPQGITVVVGGGYHGKTTLLRALERGVYPHIPGDGREYVITHRDAVKIRAEDGRSISRVDISPFISHLPQGKSTRAFMSDDASGSTSQAANIIESLEIGAKLLLIDEDTSATNFMVRDARMQALVAKESEPITPFIDRVAELHQNLGVSTVLVVGGSGDYFEPADHVLMMQSYVPHDVTHEAKDIAHALHTRRTREAQEPMSLPVPRIPVKKSFDPSRGRHGVKVDAKAKDLIAFGRSTIDLRAVEQLVDHSQTRAIGQIMCLALQTLMGQDTSLKEILDAIDKRLDEQGLDVLISRGRPGQHPGQLARPRRYEVAAAINRLRDVHMHQRNDAHGGEAT